MWWPEQTVSAVGEEDAALLDFARKIGVDCAHAHDVVGAVFSYCRARHGTADVSRDYLFFLIARSLNGMRADYRDPGGEAETINIYTACGGDGPFFLALRRSADPASLFEARRRGLVNAGRSNLCPERMMLRMNLRKIQARPREDLLLNWTSVVSRLTGWLVDWRLGNQEINTVKIMGRLGEANTWKALQPMLLDAIRLREHKAGLSPSTIHWAD